MTSLAVLSGLEPLNIAGDWQGISEQCNDAKLTGTICSFLIDALL